MLAGCGADVSVDSAENTDSSLTEDVPFAYVSRSLDGSTASGLSYQGGAKLLVRDRVSSSAGDTEVLANAIGSADYDVRDLNVSPDGKRMVFSARTANSTWNIYQYIFANGTVAPLIKDTETAEAGHDTSPVYTVDGDIVFASTRPQGSNENANSVLYRASADGSTLEQLTDSEFSDSDPAALADGGLVFIRTVTTDTAKRFELTYLNMETHAVDVLATTEVTGEGA
ncbi:MAG: hypothetical protein CMI13_08700, partial [Oleibacter sp.]|nr:hypothetical protein [Thalassolituus sp.]